MCLQEESAVRPLITDVVVTLSFLSTTPPATDPLPAATSANDASTSKQGEIDGSDHEPSARYDEESEEEEEKEGGESIAEGKDWRSSSSSKSSTRPSERSVSSSYKGSLRSEASVSSSRRSSKRSSASSSSSSRSGSQRWEGKSFREEDDESGGSRGSNSKEGSVFKSRSGSQKEKYSFDRISSVGSQATRGGDEIVSLQHNSSRGSQSGRLHSS